MTPLSSSLERLAKRLREEGDDALLHAAEWSGAGYPNRSPGVDAPVKTGNVSDPTRDAGLRRLGKPQGSDRVLRAAESHEKLLKAGEAWVEHMNASLDALKVVLPTEAYCSRCGNTTDRPHFHDGEPFCQECHESWRGEYQRDYMRTYRSDGPPAA